jgi:hypothetical protein
MPLSSRLQPLHWPKYADKGTLCSGVTVNAGIGVAEIKWSRIITENNA